MATTWVFERDGVRLRVQRQDVFGELRIAIWGGDLPERVHVFDNEVQLVAYMTALDRHLVEQGWTFVDFFPERRRGMDRRDIPRGADRRAAGGSRYTAGVHDCAAADPDATIDRS